MGNTMKHVGWVMVFLVASWHADGQIWREKYTQAQALYNQENYDQALALGTEALNGYLAEGAPSADNHAAMLRLLSMISFSRQDFAGGLTFSQKEILLREAKKDTVYAVALVNRAMFEEQLGRYPEAIQSLKAAREIYSTVYPGSHEAVLGCDIGLGTNYYLLGDLEAARKSLTPALEAADKGGTFTEEILEGFYYAGMVEVELNHGPEALSRFSRAEELLAAGELTTALTYPLAVYGKGLAFQLLRQYDEAARAFQQAQMAYEKTFGKEGEPYFTILSAQVVNTHYVQQPEKADEWIRILQSSSSGKEAYAGAAATLGVYYHGNMDYAKSEKFYREALLGFNRGDESGQVRYAETNLNLATLLADQGNTTEALQRIQESRGIIESKRGKQSTLYLVVLNRAGVVELQADHLPAAAEAFREARTLLNTLGSVPPTEQSILLNGQGELALKAGNFSRADSLYGAVIVANESQGKSPDRFYSIALNNLAASKQWQGKFSEALALIRRSVSVTRKLYGASSRAYANALENEALLQMRIGDLTAAKQSLDSAVWINEKSGGKQSLPYAFSLMSLGRFYQVTGDYTKAEPRLKEARNIIRTARGNESPDYASVQNSLALLYQTLGNYRDAEAALKEARTILEKTRGKSDAEYATVIQNLAALYQLEGAYDKAEPLLREALEIDRKVLGEDHPQYAITQQNLATLYQKLGKKEEARVILERVLDAHARHLGTRHPSYITTLSNLAALYQDMGDFARAESTWKQSVDLRKAVLGEDHPDYARSLYGLAGVYHAQGQWAKAKTYYEPVVEKYQKQVEEFFPALSEKEKSAFYAKIKPVFDAYQDFTIQYLHAVPAERDVTLGKLYDLQLSTKAILLTATNKVRARILASGNAGLQDLFRDWLSTKEQMVRYLSASQEERQRSGLNLAQMESHANDLEKKLSEQSDAFRSQMDREKVSWKDVQNALGEGDVAVEILRIRRKYTQDSVYYAGLVLQKGSTTPQLVIWPYGSLLEGKKFKYHRNTIKYHVNDTLSYSFYWLPLEEKMKNATTVFLSCDGVFNKVNFNSLYESDRRRFVIDAYRIHQVSNTRELVGRKAATATTQNSAALFGFADFNLGEADVVAHGAKRNLARSLGFEGETIPVLPATEKEVDEIAGLLARSSWAAQNYKRASATEENLKKAENPKVMHIATHGFFLSDVDLDDVESELSQNPLFRSGVLLAGAAVDREESRRDEDGVLTAYEAMNLNLDQTELVVLSACETGLGEVRNGEGVYGLQRSFLVAGANTVLMSLWQVDDVATQELMNAFYAFWLGGTEKHEAFRKAQLQMKEKYQIPYFWGAFVLIGN